MTSSNRAHEPSFEPAPQEQTDQAVPGGPSLDEVVRQTLDTQGGEEGLAAEVKDAFAGVARLHADQIALDLAVTQELVDAVLSCRFEQFRKESPMRAAAAQRIAQTIWDDSPSRERLERLWHKLREGTR